MDAASSFPDVMLLAAGLGTRLRPLTLDRPKPLVPVAGRALIDRAIDAARAEGAVRFVVNAHHLADQVIAHFAGDPMTTVLLESDLLGTGGGLRNALAALSSDPVLVMNTDAFWPLGEDAPIARLRERHAKGDVDVTLLCVAPERATGFARSHDFCLAPNGRVTADFGRPVIYGGVALCNRETIEALPEGRSSFFGLMALALEADRLGGTILDARWFHVGDGAGLAAAEAQLR